jgi:hypothetical protein
MCERPVADAEGYIMVDMDEVKRVERWRQNWDDDHTGDVVRKELETLPEATHRTVLPSQSLVHTRCQWSTFGPFWTFSGGLETSWTRPGCPRRTRGECYGESRERMAAGLSDNITVRLRARRHKFARKVVVTMP